MKLETLYKVTKTGAIQQYDVQAVDDKVIVTQGQVNGLKQDYETICKPKNVGRSNETSAAQQAYSEALSKHAKKIKAGYTLDPSGEITVTLPMKVKSYWDQKKNLAPQVYTSTKYNGVNGLYILEEDGLKLFSRGGEEYTVPLHHIEPMTSFIQDNDIGDSVNVELFIEDMFLQDIQAAVKKHNGDTHKLVAKVFDIPGKGTLPFSKRAKLMAEAKYYPGVERVDTELVTYTESNLQELHDSAVMSGYEGLVIHNPNGLYKFNQRSSDVFKMKVAQDAEFKVIGYNIDKSGHPVYLCKVNDTKQFKVKVKGTKEERLAEAKIADSKIGKWLKVEFEMLSKDGVPQKPVGIMFRLCDDNGEPLE